MSVGYELIWQHADGSHYIWQLDGAGALVSEAVPNGSIRGYEARFDQDLDGDSQFGYPAPTLVESNGFISLFEGESGYFVDGTSLAVTSGGSQVGADSFAGWSAVAVEAGLSGGYELIWQYTDGSHYIWQLDGAGALVSEGVPDGSIRDYEVRFDQDLDGDGELGIPIGADY